MKGKSLYEDLVSLLTRHLSEPTVRATIRLALERKGLTDAELGPTELPEVVASAMRGLKMFCDPSALPDLMVDLADFCHEVEESAPDR